LSNFFNLWYKRQPNARVQNGVGKHGFHSRVTSLNVAGDETLTPEELAKNRADYGAEIADPQNRLITDFHRKTMPDLSKIKAPYIALTNWAGQGLHLRGTLEAYVAGGSEDKYLYTVHGPHGELFFSDWGVSLQKKFFDKYLMDDENGWKGMPKVRLRIPRPGDPTFIKTERAYRDEEEFPLARTQYTKFYLDCANYGLTKGIPSAEGKISYRGFGPGVTFLSQPAEEEFEFTGYVKGKVYISSETTDADLFLTVRLFGPDMKEAVFVGANARNIPVAIGWLRASHRKQDPAKTREDRPWHTHNELWPLKPGEVVEMDVEIWPTSIVVPVGYRIGLKIGGKDHVYTGYKKPVQEVPVIDDLPEMTDGLGQLRHDDPLDRPAEIFDCNVTLHFDKDKRPYLLLPVIPPKAN
jgi:predicted acyl esterase